MKTQKASTVPTQTLASTDFDFETFEIKTLEDIATWNAHARKAHREARKFERRAPPPYPIKVPDESFYPKVKVKFSRFDQPSNVLKTRIRNKDIDWSGQLKPGRVYELPSPVVKFLNKLSTPIFAEVEVNDGGEVIKETRQVGEQPRFSCARMEDY